MSIDPFKYRRDKNRGVIALLLALCAVITIFLLVLLVPGLACAQEETETRFKPFPVVFTCPDQPRYAELCDPGTIYIGSLLDDADFSSAIERTAAARKWQTLYETEKSWRIAQVESLNVEIDYWRGQYETEVIEHRKTMKAAQHNPQLSFVAGAVLGTTITILVTVVVYQSRTDLEVAASGLEVARF